MASGRLPVTALPAYAGADVPRGLTRQLVRFAVVGVASTLAYLALFLLLRGPLGAQGANFAALIITAIANTAVNRRFTFGVRGAVDRFRHQLQGLVVFAVGLALTGELARAAARRSARPQALGRGGGARRGERRRHPRALPALPLVGVPARRHRHPAPRRRPPVPAGPDQRTTR